MGVVENKIAAIILAAGLGKRMKSNKAKVLHEICSTPMVIYVVEAAMGVTGTVIAVVGNQAEEVKRIISREHKVIFAFQESQLGTGHAVSCALPFIPEDVEYILILCGDVPLITRRTLANLLNHHVSSGQDITIVATELDDATGYGRILLDSNKNVIGIIEESDATDEQKLIRIINTGTYCIKKKFLIESLKNIKPDNAQQEFYLTDIVEIGYKKGNNIGVFIADNAEEFIGVNNRNDMIRAEMVMQKRLEKIS